LHYPFANVAVLCSENTSDKKLIHNTLSSKEGFLCGICKKKALGLLGAQQKERNNRVCIKTTVVRVAAQIRRPTVGL